MGKIHRHQSVAGLQKGEIDRHVRLGSTVGLNVGVLRAIKLFHSVNSQLLNLVNNLTSTVVAFARVTLCILIGENRTHRLTNRQRRDIFRRDQLDVFLLASLLLLDQAVDCWIGLLERNAVRMLRHASIMTTTDRLQPCSKLSG